MTWVTGTADDYIDLLDQLIDIVTGQSVSSVDSVAAGGTGYIVGDVLTLSGGSSTHAGKLEVLTVSGGAVLTARIEEGGAYTSPPGDPVSVTGGTGSGATFNLTFDNTGWTLNRESQEAVSATVAAGGTGYIVGDDITIVNTDGVGFDVAPVFNVDSVASGVVTAVSLVTAGSVQETTSNPATTSGGTGSGCTLTVTYQDCTTDKVALLEGSGGGSDEIFIGIKTYNKAAENGFDTVRNWQLNGMTGFNAALSYNNQVLISPETGGPNSNGGAYVPLTPDQTPTYDIGFWISATAYRILVITKCETATTTHYPSCHLGFLNRFGTSSEFPYPIYIAGASNRDDTWHADTENNRITGLTEVIGVAAKTGPAYYFRTDSVWQEVKNSDGNDTGSPTRGAKNQHTVYPAGMSDLNAVGTDDKIVSSNAAGLDWTDIIPNSGVPGTASFELQPTPQSGGDLRPQIPATLVATQGTNIEVQGELDGVFWCSVAAGETAEDRFIVGDDRYRIFPNGSRSTPTYAYMAIKES